MNPTEIADDIRNLEAMGAATKGNPIYEITIMNNETVAARRVFNFLVARRKGSEQAPVKYGNVEFWHEVPGYPAALCYSLPVDKWDQKAVQADLNADAATCWNELCAELWPLAPSTSEGYLHPKYAETEGLCPACHADPCLGEPHCP